MGISLQWQLIQNELSSRPSETVMSISMLFQEGTRIWAWKQWMQSQCFTKLVLNWWECESRVFFNHGEYKGKVQGEKLWQRQTTGLLDTNSYLVERHQPSASPTVGFWQEKRPRSCSSWRETLLGISSAAPASLRGDRSWSSHCALSLGFAECSEVCWVQPFPPGVSVVVLRKWKTNTLSCAASFQSGQQQETVVVHMESAASQLLRRAGLVISVWWISPKNAWRCISVNPAVWRSLQDAWVKPGTGLRMMVTSSALLVLQPALQPFIKPGFAIERS